MNELGRWDPRIILGVAEASRAAAAAGSAAARKAAAEAMALRYAPNLFKGLRARDLVSEIVRYFIDAYGILAIPLQLGEVPTFEFIFQRDEHDDVF